MKTGKWILRIVIRGWVDVYRWRISQAGHVWFGWVVRWICSVSIGRNRCFRCVHRLNSEMWLWICFNISCRGDSGGKKSWNYDVAQFYGFYINIFFYVDMIMIDVLFLNEIIKWFKCNTGGMADEGWCSRSGDVAKWLCIYAIQGVFRSNQVILFMEQI